MKVIVVSDIHGASEKLKIAIEFMKTEEIDQMIILGDIFNNFYELNVTSKEISQLFWSIADKIVV
ncbi:MAG: metallophosphoesterase family protein, partial [Bacilli bacterium]|nr:metallophosphoesterase family protein [Bacilli bacterium]